MSVFTYTARRDLTPGTNDLDIVTREFRLTSFRKGRKPITKQNTSISGAVESILFRSEVSYNCKTGLIEPNSDIDLQVQEFLASVENAEQFTFDRYGTIAQPDRPVTCILTSKSYTQTEVGKLYHSYGFVIREN